MKYYIYEICKYIIDKYVNIHNSFKLYPSCRPVQAAFHCYLDSLPLRCNPIMHLSDELHSGVKECLDNRQITLSYCFSQ